MHVPPVPNQPATHAAPELTELGGQAGGATQGEVPPLLVRPKLQGVHTVAPELVGTPAMVANEPTAQKEQNAAPVEVEA